MAAAGIGCHGMAHGDGPAASSASPTWAREGAQWVGVAPFTETTHLFQNIGDGTFFHSGGLALNYAVASGRQHHLQDPLQRRGGDDRRPGRGGRAPDPRAQPAARGRRASRRSSSPATTPTSTRARSIAGNAEVWHRDRLLEAQAVLAATRGVTVLIHDQQCAAEKRRLRKRGKLVDPQTRVFINERVCEGCGDCGKKSNCLSRAADRHRVRPQDRRSTSRPATRTTRACSATARRS